MTEPRILVITPSRGRPDRLAYMLQETLGLSGPGTHVAVGIDDDDPELTGYEELRETVRHTGRVLWFRGRRRTLAGWTNWIVDHPRTVRYPYLASFGDDHVPRTHGWDEQLIAAIEAGGGTGIAYGDDKHQHENLPTAPVISADIAHVLGWIVLPGVRSKFCDNAWRDLADLADCRYYVPQVVIEHVHPDAGKAGVDDTYRSGYADWAGDEAVYLAWGRSPGGDIPSQRDLDVRAVRNAMKLRVRQSV
jgi:hypothetical protein